MGRKRIQSLDALRGLAALSVCWFHLVHFNPWIHDGLLRTSGSYGYLGVEVFFVISGFIIPYSLHRSNYKIRSYGTFLLKRLARLNPPYYVCIILAVALGLISNHIPGFKGEPFQLSARQLLLNLTYSVDIFGGNWLNYVFWTLAVEIQFYLIVGLIYPLISNPSLVVRSIIFLLVATCALLFPGTAFVAHFGFVFLLGIVTFQYEAAFVDRKFYLALTAVCCGGVFLTMGAPAALVALATAFIIAFIPIDIPILQFLGGISYSLYLVHMLIYMRVFNLVMRVSGGGLGIACAIFVSMAVIVISAYLLFKFVEVPSQKLSSSIKYPSNGEIHA